MRIAILGAGGAGLASAFVLQHDHDVTVYEREAELGGHARSLPVSVGDRVVFAETGFKFFFDPGYPSLHALLRLVEVHPVKVPTTITLTREGRKTLTLPPRGLRGAWGLATSPTSLHELYWLQRLLFSAKAVVLSEHWGMTLREHCDAIGMPRAVQDALILPMIAANWGAPLARMPVFPAYSVLKVLWRENLFDPHLYEIPGGISAYIQAVTRQLTRVTILTDCAAVALHRVGLEWQVVDAHGEARTFDHIVLAGSSREALQLVDGVSDAMSLAGVLRQFSHFDTIIAVHRDSSFMPGDRRDWSLLNVFIEHEDTWQTEWTGWRSDDRVFRTWLPRDGRQPKDPLLVRSFHHLIVTPDNRRLQKELEALQGTSGLSCVGMYTTDVDNHESVLRSARALGHRLAPASPTLAAWEQEITRGISTSRRIPSDTGPGSST